MGLGLNRPRSLERSRAACVNLIKKNCYTDRVGERLPLAIPLGIALSIIIITLDGARFPASALEVKNQPCYATGLVRELSLLLQKG